MFRPFAIPRYTSRDFQILVASMLPMGMLINYFLFGYRYISNAAVFSGATVSTFIYLGIAFITYGFVAIFLRNRFPNDQQFFKRLAICLSVFFLMSAVYTSFLLLLYDYLDLYGYEYTENDFTKCYITLVVVNVFLTFLNEGIYRFEKYRTIAMETEQLKKEYMHSQLLGLKSQMKPHFLFNSLNSLSCLINDDAGKAEDFLNHMSRVYRYLLRNNEEQLVTLETELDFIRSYYFLLKQRHAEGLELLIDVSPEQMEAMIPPLTLQMIMENAIGLNTLSRSNPLHIKLYTVEGRLEIRNNIQPRLNGQENELDVMEHISNKYRLLCQQEVVIREDENERTIRLPLIPEKETMVI